MKALVIAEKPSVARDIARVLKCGKKINGAIEGECYIVTWGLGHLVTLADPEDYDKKYKNCYDYNKRDDFKYKNAILTSEGAIALYKENSNKAIYGSNILITGFGKIGKSLCNVLKAMGSKLTVCARSDIDKAQAKTIADKVIDFKALQCQNYDIIFNTVPAIYFTKKEIDTFKNDIKYIELASFPGGIDKHYAKIKSIDIIDGSKLPSRYSKISAGYLIGETIDKMIKEGKN